MGLFTNPLSHAGYPPGVTGTPSTQPSEVRAATSAEAIAGTLNNVYISPATFSGSGSDLGPRTLHGVIIGEGITNPMGATAAGSAGQLLTSGGASADPLWTTATFPATATSTGTILRANGTNWIASTATYPNTATAGALIAATATNVIGEIADVATGQALMSGGVGVIPAYSGSPSFSGSVTAGTGITSTTGNIVASAGNISATLGSVAAATTVTAGTSITATLGNITATNGNLVLGTTGNKLVIHATTAASDSIGTSAVLDGASPSQLVVSTTAVKTGSIILLSYGTAGGTQGSLSVGTIVDSTSFQIKSSANGDTSTVNYLIIN